MLLENRRREFPAGPSRPASNHSRKLHARHHVQESQTLHKKTLKEGRKRGREEGKKEENLEEERNKRKEGTKERKERTNEHFHWINASFKSLRMMNAFANFPPL
jgi:hypothetical protein